MKARFVPLAVTSTAILLLAAGVMKMLDIFTASESEGWIYSRLWEGALSVWEIALGLLTVLSRPRRLIWSLLVTTFAAFSAGSLGKASSVAQSCGCFGGLHVNPWATFGIDIGALSVLALSRNHWTGHSLEQGRQQPTSSVTACAMIAAV